MNHVYAMTLGQFGRRLAVAAAAGFVAGAILGASLPARAASPDPLGGLGGETCEHVVRAAAAIFQARNRCGFTVKSPQFRAMVQQCMGKMSKPEAMVAITDGIRDFDADAMRYGEGRTCNAVAKDVPGVLSR